MREVQTGVWHWEAPPPEQTLETLRPLLALPVELVLPTHGAAQRPSRARLTPEHGAERRDDPLELTQVGAAASDRRRGRR